MKYKRASFSVGVGESEDYRKNFDRVFENRDSGETPYCPECDRRDQVFTLRTLSHAIPGVPPLTEYRCKRCALKWDSLHDADRQNNQDG